jgi:mutator protein MutT
MPNPSSNPVPAPVIPVVAGLVFRDGRLLITRRPPGTHLAGHWEFPGGKLDPGEDWLPALHRELREELAIEVETGPLVEDLVHEYPGKQVHLRFYQCRWQAGEPQTLGCDALAWVRAEELERYPFPAADARLLDRLRAEPHWWTA